MNDQASKFHRRPWLLLLLTLLPFSAWSAPARQNLPVQAGSWSHSDQADWAPGSFVNTLVDGGTLRLATGQASGQFTSAPLQAPAGFNAGLVEWDARPSTGDALTIELRSSVDGVVWDEWQPAVAIHRQPRAVSQLFVFKLFTSYLQYRVSFGAADAPALDAIELTYISSIAGPSLTEIVGRVSLVGPVTLTPAPEAVARAEWAGAQPAARTERQRPARVELAQVLAPVDDPNPLATLRALRWAYQNILGQADLPFHYLIDGAGNIYEGRGSVTQRITEADEGTVRIAVLANAEAEGVSEAAQARLIGVLAWLSASYDVPLAAITAAPEAPERVRQLVDELRPAVRGAVVRSRTIFGEGSTADATERVALFNPAGEEARVTLAALTPGGEELRTVVVPPMQRVDVTLNGTLPATTTVGLEIQSDGALVAERSLIVGRELLGSTGAEEPARVWYFGEGTTITDTTTTLAVVNPQRQEVQGTLTLYPDGTAPLTQTATFGPRSRTTLQLNELIPDAQFGMKLVTSQPVVAERTVVLESGAAHLATGIANLSRDWTFAEGSTTEGFATTLHLLNPWPQQVAVSLQVMSEDGTSLSRRYAVPAASRFVLSLNDVVPALPFAMRIQAERPVAAERVMRFDGGVGATATAGSPRLATRWIFAEGSTAVPAAEYLLVANPNRSAVQLEVMYILSGGQVETRTYAMPSTARLTISVNSDVPDQDLVSTIVTASRPVVAERSIFVAGAQGRGGETSLGAAGR